MDFKKALEQGKITIHQLVEFYWTYRALEMAGYPYANRKAQQILPLIEGVMEI